MPRHTSRSLPIQRGHAVAEDLFAAAPKPEPHSLTELNEEMAAAGPMVEGGKRAVFGEGPIGAALALVGEQPGDQEDLQGHPFVGPAGQLLDRAMAAAGIDRSRSYVTNAVKHFKFQQRGKRRIHEKPTMGEVKHYRWWLFKELEFVHPKLVVALGGTAAYALSGKSVTIGKSRGPAEFGEFHGFITVHPSAMLRMRDHDEREAAFLDFVRDLKGARKLAAQSH
ncbi:MAG: UdgX family uracil-DNA binding protein [Proteobacteria bacterium]|nr:UdgX family uracil-DNA binding protein [Pseudomonadota bacterium]